MVSGSWRGFVDGVGLAMSWMWLLEIFVALEVSKRKRLPLMQRGASSAMSELYPSTAQPTIENLNTGVTGSGNFVGIQVASQPSQSRYSVLSRYASVT